MEKLLESLSSYWQKRYGLIVQILGSLITYLLLAIYCRKHHQEKVSIKRVRELPIKIHNETRNPEISPLGCQSFHDHWKGHLYAKA